MCVFSAICIICSTTTFCSHTASENRQTIYCGNEVQFDMNLRNHHLCYALMHRTSAHNKVYPVCKQFNYIAVLFRFLHSSIVHKSISNWLVLWSNIYSVSRRGNREEQVLLFFFIVCLDTKHLYTLAWLTTAHTLTWQPNQFPGKYCGKPGNGNAWYIALLVASGWCANC